MNSVEMRKKEEELNERAVELFSMYQGYETIVPRFPYTIVRILPKDYVTHAGIILAGEVKGANKISYEGVVLRVWEPRLILRKGQSEPPTMISSELKVGDHVVFPHYAGQPLPGFDENLYRMVPEGIARNGAVLFGTEVGCIFATVNYERESVEGTFRRVLKEIASDYNPKTDNFDNMLLTAMQENFDMFVKVSESVTTSGR